VEGNWSKREHCFTFLNMCCHLLVHSGTQTNEQRVEVRGKARQMVLLFRR